jgi:hypothetical protein
LSGEGSGEGERQWLVVTPAAAVVSGRERETPSNGGRHKLLWLLGSELEGLGALEKGRGGELAGGRQWWDGGGRRRARSSDEVVTAQDARRSTAPSAGARTAGSAPGRYGAARRARPRENSEGSRGAAHGEARASGGGGLGRRGRGCRGRPAHGRGARTRATSRAAAPRV